MDAIRAGFSRRQAETERHELVIEAIFTIDNGIYGDREGFLRDSVYELADRLAAAFKVQEILLASFQESPTAP